MVFFSCVFFFSRETNREKNFGGVGIQYRDEQKGSQKIWQKLNLVGPLFVLMYEASFSSSFFFFFESKNTKSQPLDSMTKTRIHHNFVKP